MLNKFIIKKLYGSRSYNIPIVDNKLIFLGENGTGKTTILRILYLFLTKQWAQLAQYSFEEITLKTDQVRIEIKYEYISMFKEIDSRLMLNFENYDESLKDMIFEKIISEGSSGLIHSIIRYGDEERIFLKSTSKKKKNVKSGREYLKSASENLDKLGINVLYLPTYRRIELELSKLVNETKGSKSKGLKETGKRGDNYIELIEFGMKDVKDAVESTCSSISNFVRDKSRNLSIEYLSDIVEKKYENVDTASLADVELDRIEQILSRVDESVLSSESKQRMSVALNEVRNKNKLEPHDKILCHYFSNLVQLNDDIIEKEQYITSFCNICNNYLVDKKLVYDPDKIKISILLEEKSAESSEIEWNMLSSGEKQVISIFNHLSLTKVPNKYLVIIDEPELSLSVDWQNRFIGDIDSSKNCFGIIAATHSPFIYDNIFDHYAHGIGEFLISGD